jgi:hypothetical protein
MYMVKHGPRSWWDKKYIIEKETKRMTVNGEFQRVLGHLRSKTIVDGKMVISGLRNLKSFISVIKYK